MDSLTNVNNYLSAKTEDELLELQILNNHVNGIRYAYQTPVWTGDKWVIWFFADLQEWNDPRNLEGDALKLAKGEL